MKVENTENTPSNDLFLVGMPLETYQKLQAEALKRGITLAELVGRAVDGYISSTSTNKPAAESAVSSRKLLLENSARS